MLPEKIKEIESKEIKIILFYCMELVGFPPENIDSGQLKTIIDFLKGNFPHFKVINIKNAFDLGVKGDFEIDMRHFKSFDSLYVTKVIKAYTLYVNKQNAKPKLVDPIDKQLPMSKQSREEEQKQKFEMIDNWVKEKGEIPSLAYWSEAFRHMIRIGLIKISEKEATEFREGVIISLKAKIKDVRYKNKGLESVQETSLQMKLVSKDSIIKECEKQFIINYYKENNNNVC